MASRPTLPRLLALFLFVFAVLPGCGGGGGSAPPPVPAATTAAPTGISLHAAILNGTVNPEAQATNAWFEWGTDNTLATFTPTSRQAVGAGSADNSVSAAVTGLALGTTYYYRVVAENASGTQEGRIASFTTALPNSPPGVATEAATSVTISGAVLNGTVNPNELDTTAVFEWGTHLDLATYTSTAPQLLGVGTTSVAITASLSGLTPGTTYYYRVTATNAAGPSEGTIVRFDTVAQPPTVTTGAATAITGNGATLNGSVNPNGLAVSDYHFEYGTDPTLATFTVTSLQTLAAGFTGQGTTDSISGLTPGTTYYFRVVATNAAGTSNGTIVRFDTVAQPPTVATAAATSITGNSATLNGSVNPNGLAVSDYHFEYGTDSTLTTFSATSSQTLSAGFAEQSIAASLSGLAPGTTYYFRVVATNPAGTSPSAIMDFTTDSFGTGAFTYNAPGHNAKVATGNGKAVIFSKLLPAVTNFSGVFSLDFAPTSEYGSGGDISVRLNDTPTTYIQLSTKDAMVTKVRKGVVVDSASFPHSYAQGNTYSIRITFSQMNTTFEAFGGSVSLTTDTSANPIIYFEVETMQQDAYYDNIRLETGTPPGQVYFDDFSTDTTGSYLVF
jgi:phosphodiesterase/alkaline phosphatase D-like protein